MLQVVMVVLNAPVIPKKRKKKDKRKEREANLDGLKYYGTYGWS